MRRETRWSLWTSMGLALWMAACRTAPAPTPAREVAFVDVNVVPMDSERLLTHQTVVVRT
jgi:hypothetical protein